MADVRECLDTIVWGDEIDPFPCAVQVMNSCWWSGPYFQCEIQDWAWAHFHEYDEKCAAIANRCDLNDPGVKMIYEHYSNIRDRYWKVREAFGPL